MEGTERAIADAVGRIEGIDALLVFGSRTKEGFRRDSDLDVAVLPSEAPGGDRRRLQTRLAVALAHLAPEGRVDVVLLDEAPALLRQRIFESARPVLVREPARLAELRVRTMREHGDREPYRELLMSALARRLSRTGAARG